MTKKKPRPHLTSDFKYQALSEVHCGGTDATQTHCQINIHQHSNRSRKQLQETKICTPESQTEKHDENNVGNVKGTKNKPQVILYETKTQELNKVNKTQ